MIGTCPRCGKEFVRPAECDVAACDCESSVEVPLKPALIFPRSIYNRLQRAADEAGVTVERIVEEILKVGFKNYEVPQSKSK